MATPASTHAAHDDHAHDHGDHGHPTGWRRFVYSTNNKDIGTMYLAFSLFGGAVGGILSLGIRLQLMHPGGQFLHDSHQFNAFITAHGLIMIFFMVMPAMIGGVGDVVCRPL